MTKLYRNHGPLHTLEPHYSAHVSAMTSEALHGKGEIAAELAYRDARIEELKAALTPLAHGRAAYHRCRMEGHRGARVRCSRIEGRRRWRVADAQSASREFR